MSYILQEPTEFINIKLTDTGRKYLAKGLLTFDRVAVSDREINYGFARGLYDVCQNYVLSPQDDNPNFPNDNELVNYDGTSAMTVDLVTVQTQAITATTASQGIFTGSTNAWAIDQSNSCLGTNEIHYSAATISGSSTITLGGAGYTPDEGQFVYIPWQPKQNSGVTNNTSTILSANSIVGLWYRVTDASSYPIITLDRSTPNFGPSSTDQIVPAFFFPYNGVEDYYGSASTLDTKVWNMNIVRTSSEPGTDDTISGYTSYGSVEYNGTKHYLGFSSETRAFGILHFTNQFTGNTYSEQLVEKSVVVNLPTVMWHHTASIGGTGKANTVGLTLTDSSSYDSPAPNGATGTNAVDNTMIDHAAGTSYRFLADSSNNVVGRVYHKLKIIIITDPELLTALSYKSNRNYTLPNFTVQETNSPAYPLESGTTVGGLMQSGKTYFVTYITESDAYSDGVSYGYPQALPCGYMQSYVGTSNSNGDKKFLRFKIDEPAPYLRESANMVAGALVITGGTGWNANKIQLLVNIVDTSTNTQVDTVPSESWKLISNEIGNGVFTGASQAITASEMQGLDMVISQQDYDSGTTYVLSGQFSAFTQNPDYAAGGLTFGNESFLFGNITAGIRATTFKSVITILMPDTEFNSSNNASFLSTGSAPDTDTFITEIGVFKTSNTFVAGTPDLVAVGKMSYPITKNTTRYLVFQTEVDF